MKKKTIMFMARVFLLISVFSSVVTIDGQTADFVRLEGNHVDFYVPEENQGINFLEILTDFEATKVCDMAYEVCMEIMGWDPFPGEKITVRAYGYDGQENKPQLAAFAFAPNRLIGVYYDRLSQESSLFNGDIPNFGLLFHELTHLFTPHEFRNANPSGRSEALAYFMDGLIYTVIVDNAQVYGLNPANVEKMQIEKEDIKSWEKSIDPSRDIEWSGDQLNAGFLYQVANDFEDYGRNVFRMFFKLLYDSDIDLRGVDDEAFKSDALHVAIVDTVTNSDYRDLFRYYRFELDDSYYAFYKSLLSPLVKDTFIISMFPTSGNVGTTVNIVGKIESSGGAFSAYFNKDRDGDLFETGEMVTEGNALVTSYSVNTSFMIPDCGGSTNGSYLVTLRDTQTLSYDTVEFEVIVDTSSHARFKVTTFHVIFETNTFVVETCSNSSVSDLVFNQPLKRIQFNVNGTTGTTGACNITIPVELMSGDFSIYKDDILLIKNVDYNETYNGTHYQFSFTYDHSTHTIEIYSTTAIPELSSLLLPIFITAIITVIIYGKRLPKKRIR